MSSTEWLQKEKDLLSQYFPKMGAEYCSKVIGRTKRACQEMAKKLKLKRTFIYENKEEFEVLIKSSKSYTECVIKIGLSPRCSGNFQTIKKYIKLYEINIDHFESGFKIGNTPKNKLNLKDILNKDCFVTRKVIKNKLYKEGIKEKVCEICGQDENWFNGTKIVHILDHINGDAYDNRLENLRIICPNCNSTLETNCSKNKVKRVYDKENDEYKSQKTHKKCSCGKLILKDSNFCKDCYSINQRKVKNRPSYEELLKLVDENGNTGTGKLLGVSEAVIRKWLKQYKKQLV